MRKFYDEFFYIPKHGKVREKVMLTRIATTVTVIMMCLAAMSFTAYAYFSCNITSGSSVIKSASFYTDVTVQITDASGNEVEVITSDYVSHFANGLKANQTYYITLKHTDRSTAQTGFVVLTAEGCATRYHTQQLGRDGDGNTATITFTIVPGADTDVKFYSHWGTSCFYSDFKEINENDERYITQGEEIKLTVDGAVPGSNQGGTEDPSDDGSEGNAAESTSTIPETGTESSPESTTTPSIETTEPAETTPPDTTDSTEESDTTEPNATTAEPQTTQPDQSTETTGTGSAEPTETETEETRPETETAETTDAPTIETNE